MILKRGNVIEFEIQDLAFGGKGITKLPTPEGELVVFTPNTIAGQKVKARIFKKKKRYIECKLIEILERSPLEKEFDYQPISGAPYITLPIEEQHKYKQKNTLELYKRIAKVDNVDEIFDEFTMICVVHVILYGSGACVCPSRAQLTARISCLFSCTRFNLGELLGCSGIL